VALVERIYQFQELLLKQRSLLVLGPRGTGKSSFVRQLLKVWGVSGMEIDLLKGEQFRRYLSNPEQLRADIAGKLSALESRHVPDAKPLLVFIDEIQLVPALLNEVHSLIETYKPALNFILTGSSLRKLKRSGANLLAGRALLQSFFPLTCEELDFTTNLDTIVCRGTLPTAFFEVNFPLLREFLATYTTTYLKEEIQREAEVRNVEAFHRFLEIAAQANGQPINYSSIGKDAKVSGDTVKEYFTILEDTLIATKIPAWTHSKREQLRKAPKYYFFDNGVMLSTGNQLIESVGRSSKIFGQLFENVVVNEVIRINAIHKLGFQLYHYRTDGGKEIDLILQRTPFDPPIGIEVKSASRPTPADVAPLKLLLDENSSADLRVFCTTPVPYEMDGIKFLPFVEGVKGLLTS